MIEDNGSKSPSILNQCSNDLESKFCDAREKRSMLVTTIQVQRSVALCFFVAFFETLSTANKVSKLLSNGSGMPYPIPYVMRLARAFESAGREIKEQIQ